MGFRFPHPFENIGDAIKDALDPDTPADGGLAVQLMNENNRAVEDALSAMGSGAFDSASGTENLDGSGECVITLAPPIDSEKFGIQMVSVNISGTTGASIAWFSLITSTDNYGPYSVNLLSGSGSMSMPWFGGPFPQIEEVSISVPGATSGVATAAVIYPV